MNTIHNEMRQQFDTYLSWYERQSGHAIQMEHLYVYPQIDTNGNILYKEFHPSQTAGLVGDTTVCFSRYVFKFFSMRQNRMVSCFFNGSYLPLFDGAFRRCVDIDTIEALGLLQALAELYYVIQQKHVAVIHDNERDKTVLELFEWIVFIDKNNTTSSSSPLRSILGTKPNRREALYIEARGWLCANTRFHTYKVEVFPHWEEKRIRLALYHPFHRQVLSFCYDNDQKQYLASYKAFTIEIASFLKKNLLFTENE